MKKRYRKMSLCSKICVIFGLVNFIVMGIFIIFLYRYFQGTVKDFVTKAVDSTVSTNNREMETLLERIEYAYGLVHKNENIYTASGGDLSNIGKMIVQYKAEKSNKELQKVIETYKENLQLFNDYFENCFTNGMNYNSILYVDTKWPIHVFMQNRSISNGWNGFSTNALIKEEEWYQETELRDGECYWFVQSDSNKLCMAKLLKYRYVDSGLNMYCETLGTLVVSFDVSSISNYINMNGLTPDSYVLFYDEDDMLVHAVNADIAEDQISGKLIEVEQDITKEMLIDERECLVNKKELPLGLQMVTVVPIDDIHQMTFKIVKIIIFAGFAVIGVTILFGIFLSASVILPLKKFTKYMAEGNIDKFSFDQSREDEIGILFRTYNKLMVDLDNSMKKTLEANEKRKQAEFQTLQAQINPHFIYNTLNSISCLAMISQQEHIADLITNLTKIMRYRISYHKNLVTIAEEIDTIRQYESIQKCCYRDRVNFEYSIEQEAESFLIPKLMIQPLLENALIHSVNPDEKVIKVRLEIRIEQNKLVICVSDNGTKANVDEINRYMIAQGDYKGDSIGIRNIYERIMLEFGEDTKFRYYKNENGYTVACIRLPRTS